MTPQPSFFDEIWANKWSFLGVFFIIFTLSYGFLYALDWLPEAPTTGTNATSTATTTVPVVKPAVPAKAVSPLPISISIPSLERKVTVLNPNDRSIASLDAALLKGAARHPDSGVLGKEGNILILGHSSYLPTVMNHNFQAFNGIQKLKWGDTIVLTSTDGEYTYRVDKVYQAKASAVSIPTEVKGERLTLVTCNSFGAKEDRFIVEATLVSEKALATNAR